MTSHRLCFARSLRSPRLQYDITAYKHRLARHIWPQWLSGWLGFSVHSQKFPQNGPDFNRNEPKTQSKSGPKEKTNQGFLNKLRADLHSTICSNFIFFLQHHKLRKEAKFWFAVSCMWRSMPQIYAYQKFPAFWMELEWCTCCNYVDKNNYENLTWHCTSDYSENPNALY